MRMKQVTINFDHVEEDPFTSDDLWLCLKSRKMYMAFADLRELLRNHEKYGSEELTLERFHQILQDNDLGGMDL